MYNRSGCWWYFERYLALKTEFPYMDIKEEAEITFKIIFGNLICEFHIVSLRMWYPISNIKGDIGNFREISFYGHNSLMSQANLFGQRRKELAYDPRYIIF